MAPQGAWSVHNMPWGTGAPRPQPAFSAQQPPAAQRPRSFADCQLAALLRG